MSSWHALQEELQRLVRLSPTPLRSYPGLDPPHSLRGPVEIDLAAHATAVAAELHARFGDLVRLRVGLLAYPENKAQLAGKRRKRSGGSRPFLMAGERPLAERLGLHVGLADRASPPVICSGHSEQVPVKVTNHSAVDRHLQSNGYLRAYVVDAEGTIVGSNYGFHTMSLVVFSARRNESVTVPALISTASLDIDLGYSIPPGDWGFIVKLVLGGHLRTPRAEEVTVWSNAIPFEIRAEG